MIGVKTYDNYAHTLYDTNISILLTGTLLIDAHFKISS